MFGGLLTLLVIGFLMRTGFRRWRGRDTNLPVFLAEAEQAGIITGEQRERLLAHAEISGGARSRLDGARSLGILAGLFVVAGVSLLIATNWESIGPGVRIAAFLGLLTVVGEAAIRWRDRSLGVSVPLELLWMFLPLLGIGLYGQTFQLSGDPVGPYLLWLVLTMPIAWLSPRPIAAIVHTVAIAVVVMTGNFAAEPGAALFGDANAPAGILALTDGAGSLRGWLLTLAMLGAMILQSLRLLPRRHRHHFVGVLALWIMCLLVAQTPFEIDHPGWLSIAALSLTTAWVLVMAAARTSMEERATSFFAWIATIYALGFTWHMDFAAHGDTSGAGIVLVLLIALGTVGGTMILPDDRLSPVPGWARTARVLLLTPLVAAFAFLLGSVGLMVLAAIVMNLAMLSIAIALMWHGSIVREPQQINAGVLVLVIVLITRFLDIFGGMLTSGIGFIVAGLLLAGLSWLLERTRRRLIDAPPQVTP